jgi:hypothetical protein
METKAKITKAITTCYSAEKVGDEDYKILEEIYVSKHLISYDAQGRCQCETFIEKYPEYTTRASVHYKDGLPDCKWSEGSQIGTYTRETTPENLIIESYTGEDGFYTKTYYNDMLVFERKQYDDEADMIEYEYDDEERIVRKRIVHDDINNGPTFLIADYIFQDNMTMKEISYRCESPSIDDFFKDNYTKCNDVDEIVRTEYLEEIGDEGTCISRLYDLKEDRILSKTISVYNISSNNIVRKTHITYGQSDETLVEETIYSY